MKQIAVEIGLESEKNTNGGWFCVIKGKESMKKGEKTAGKGEEGWL